MKKSTKKQLITAFILIMFLGSGFIGALLYAFPSTTNTTGWYAGLFIVIHEQVQQIPAGVGVISDETREKLYTLDYNNIIFKDTDEDATLGEFFDIWNETFNSNCILDYCNNENHSMRMYVNDIENFEYEFYVIKNRDTIIIDYR